MKTRHAREIREQVAAAQADATQQYDPDDHNMRPFSWDASRKKYRKYLIYREAYWSATRKMFNQATPEEQARMIEENRLRNLSPAERQHEELLREIHTIKSAINTLQSQVDRG